MKYLNILFLLLFSATVLLAQNQKIEITGTVLEINSKQPVEFATLTIADVTTKKVITGTATDLDGTFKISTNATDFYIEVSFLVLIKK